MKLFLFFLTCILIVNQSFGQNYTIQNNGAINNNASSEELKLEVPAPQTMPELREEVEKESKDKQISKKASVNSFKSAESSNAVFSSSKKIASTQLTSRSPSSTQQQEMDQAIRFYKENAPESFEYHYFTYTAGNYDISLFPHLKKAQELKPANSDVVVQLAAYNLITENTAEAAKNLTNLVEIGKIEPEVLVYDTDLLNSVPMNGVLLTHGFDDGYGSFDLNTATHLRSDVKIISLDFMQSKVYRDSLQKDGFTMPASTTIDVQFLSEFCRRNENKNLFLSMTFPKPYLVPIAEKLSVRGLVFAYGSKESAVLEENQKLWNKMLENGFIFKTRTEKGKQLSSNYLPLLFYLRESHEAKGENEQLIEIDKAIDRIGVQSNKFSKVNSMRKQK